MKQFFFSALFIFMVSLVQAQEYTVIGVDGEVENSKMEIATECQTKLDSLKQKYIEINSSQQGIYLRKLTKEFYSKLHAAPPDSKNLKKHEEELLGWIEANIDKTDFKNIDEAKSARIKIKEAQTAINNAYPEYSDLLVKTYQSCGAQAVANLMKEMVAIFR